MKKILLSVLILTAAVLLLHVVFSYRKYNVILITIDTLRSDFLSCYNKNAPPTPHIDALARKGVLFEKAYTLIPITMPAHTSILTSRSPHLVNVFNNGDTFNNHVPMLTDLLEDKGYQTGGFVSLGVLKREYGLGSGFDHYEDNFDQVNGRYYKIASEINRLAIPWIEKVHKSPFFAWVHYSDPHEPYIPPDAAPDTEIIINGVAYTKFCVAKKEKNVFTFMAQPGENSIVFRAIVEPGPRKIQLAHSKRFIDDSIQIFPSETIDMRMSESLQKIKLQTGRGAWYFAQEAEITLINKTSAPVHTTFRFGGGVFAQRIGEVRKNYVTELQFVDKNIGELWQKLVDLGIEKNTIILLTSDHGEGLKSHGILGHVDRFWNEITHVPFIVYYPKLGYRGKRVKPMVNHLDIMPTILDLLHVKNISPMEGRSLKRYVSYSPVDWLTSKPVSRQQNFFSTYAPEARVNSFAVFDGKIKLVHSPNRAIFKWEAYDLSEDPLEKRNIARLQPDRFESFTILRGLLESHRKEAEMAHSRRKNPELTAEEIEMLHNLGYIGGSEDEDENDNGNQR